MEYCMLFIKNDVNIRHIRLKQLYKEEKYKYLYESASAKI